MEAQIDVSGADRVNAVMGSAGMSRRRANASCRRWGLRRRVRRRFRLASKWARDPSGGLDWDLVADSEVEFIERLSQAIASTDGEIEVGDEE